MVSSTRHVLRNRHDGILLISFLLVSRMFAGFTEVSQMDAKAFSRILLQALDKNIRVFAIYIWC